MERRRCIPDEVRERAVLRSVPANCRRSSDGDVGVMTVVLAGGNPVAGLI